MTAMSQNVGNMVYGRTNRVTKVGEYLSLINIYATKKLPNVILYKYTRLYAMNVYLGVCIAKRKQG